MFATSLLSLRSRLPVSLRITLFSALLATVLLSADQPSPLSAATGDVKASFAAPNSPGSRDSGRGIAFDGDYVYYTANDATNPPVATTDIYKLRIDSGSSYTLVQTIATSPATELESLAWDGQTLWATDASPASAKQFYKVDRATGAVTPQFPLDLSGSLAACEVGEAKDGLTYDFTTGTLWVSAVSSRRVFNVGTSGTILRSFDISTNDCITGLSANGETLWAFLLDKNDPAPADCPSGRRLLNLAFDGSTIGSPVSACRVYADMDFDPVTFAPSCVVWSSSLYESVAFQFTYPARIDAFEVPCASSGYNPSHYGSLSSEANPSVGDPVNPIFGNFNHQQTDISIPARGLPLEFMRTYNSAASSVDGPLGFGWTHNYDTHLEFESGAVVVVQPDGRQDRYLSLGGGAYLSPPDFFDALQESGGIYTLTTVSQIKYTFDSAGKLTSIADRNSNTTNLAYYGSGPDAGRLQTVTEPTGRTLTFTYTSGRILRVTESAPLSRYVEFSYDANGNLQTVRDVNGGTTMYTYSSAHQLEKVKDSNNNWSVQNCYVASTGKVTKQFGAPFPDSSEPPQTNCDLDPPVARDLGLLLTEFQYNTPGVGQTTLRDPKNLSTVYKFDNLFRVTKITDALNGITEYTYDSHSNRTCVKDPRGNRTSYSYDATGNVTRMVDAQHTDTSCNLKPPPDDKAWNYSFTPKNDIETETDPLNHQTEYIYDSVGNLTRVVRRETPGGTIKSLTCFEYKDAPGRQTAILKSTDLVLPGSETADCTGNRTKFEYDDVYDNLTATINAEFSDTGTPKTTFAVDAGGRTETVTNELGHVTTNTFDSRGALLSTMDQLGHTTSFTYDNKGNLQTFTDANRKPNGVAETGSACGTLGTGDQIDSDGDTQVDDGCPSTIYSYDGGDRVTQVVDGLGNTTVYGYDANGKLAAETPPNRKTQGTAETGTQCGSAGTGNGIDEDVDILVDDGCPQTLYAYDALNRLIATTDGLGHVTSYQYDASGNPTATVDGKHAAVGPPESGASQCGTGGGGNNSDDDSDSVADDGCPANIYQFDELNRLKRAEHWGSGVVNDTVDYTYDLAGNRITMTDSTGVTTWDYDVLNRLTLVTTPAVTATGCTTQPQCSKTVSYDYDDLPGGAVADYPGMRTKVTYPDATTVTYTYYKDGRMNSVTDWLNKTTQYTYNDARLLSTVAFPSPAGTVAYGYDAADRTNQVTHQLTTSESLTYVRDAFGNISQVTRTNEQPEKYEYDALQRLDRVEYPDAKVVDYTYDGNGNRETLNDSVSGLVTYDYNSADQLTQVGGTAYTSDPNGNLSGRASESYEYDQENRLTKIAFNGFPAQNNPASTIASSAAGNPTTITTSGSHGLKTGDIVIISGHSGSTPPINGENQATVTSTTTFTIPVSLAAGGAGGTVHKKNLCYDFVGDPGNGTGQGKVTILDLASFIAPVRRLDTSPGDQGYDPYWDTLPGSSGLGKFINITDLARMIAPVNSMNQNCAREFKYNGDGLRVSQTIGRFRSDYVWDLGEGNPVVLQETNREDFFRSNPDPNDTAVYRTRSEYTYVYGVGLVSITDGQGNQRYVLPDALGSVRTLSAGADGSVYAAYSYDAFGSPRTLAGPHTTFRFTGEQYDFKARAQGDFSLTGMNGLYYLRARYYDPAIGRFLTRDPLPGSALAPQSLNPYPYVGNNPVNRVDPSGRLSEGPVLLTLEPYPFDCLQLTMEAAGALALALVVIAPLSGYHPLIAGGYIGGAAIFLTVFYLECKGIQDSG